MVMAVTAAACGSTRHADAGALRNGIADSQGTKAPGKKTGRFPHWPCLWMKHGGPMKNGRRNTRRFEKRLGVNIEVTRAADDNNFLLWWLPAICLTSYVLEYRYLADSQVCYPWTKLHETYPEIEFNVDPIFQFVNKAWMTIIIPSAAVLPEYDYDKYDKILSEGPSFMLAVILLRNWALNSKLPE